jgi:hypothetical protein
VKDYEAKEEVIELTHDNVDLINMKAYEFASDVLMSEKRLFIFY